MADSETEAILSHQEDTDIDTKLHIITKNHNQRLAFNVWNIIGACIGHSLEWFDWSLFALLADEIGANYFPSHNHVFEVLSTFAVFGCGFLMRPIGGSVLGCIGDKSGRVTSLKISIYIMAVSSLLTGILPNYNFLGVSAPILLTIFRLIQGLSVGGEGTGAMTYIIEIAPRNHLALYVSFLSLAGSGFIFANLFVGVLRYVYTSEQMVSFAWRIPFLFGALIGVVGIWIRKGLKHSEAFASAKLEGLTHSNPLRESFRREKSNMFIIMCHLAFGAASGYCLHTWVPSYVLTKDVNPIHNIYLINCMGLFVHKVIVIPTALFIDKYLSSDPTYTLIGFGTLRIICILWFFVYLPTINSTQMIVWVISFGFVDGIYGIGVGLWAILRLKNVVIRYSTYGFSYNVSVALFGGSAPFLSSLILLTSGVFSIGVYLALIGVMSVGTNAIWYYVDRIQKKQTEIELEEHVSSDQLQQR